MMRPPFFAAAFDAAKVVHAVFYSPLVDMTSSLASGCELLQLN